MSQPPTTFEEWWVGSYYKRFVESEGVPLYEGSILEDLASLPLKDWERTTHSRVQRHGFRSN